MLQQELLGDAQETVNRLIRTGLVGFAELDKPIHALSTGQRRRLDLARLIIRKPNVLLLDEPTNHFSLDILEAFETVLEAFHGPVLLVSHDEYLIDRLGWPIWRLGKGHLSTE